MEIKKRILNDDGLHARPAGMLAKTSAGFQSKIQIVFNSRTVNAKSSMSLMTLGLAKDDEVNIQAEGPDAEMALTKISELIDCKFQV